MSTFSNPRETPLARKVARKLAEVGVTYPAGTKFSLEKLSPGYHQKAAGAWAWALWVKLPTLDEWRPCGIGSPDQASLLREHHKFTSPGITGSVYFIE